MAVGIETRILDALNAWLAALTLSPVVPIAWPNLNFIPSGAYLQPFLLPSRTEALEANVSGRGPNQYHGDYQVSVFYPTGSGVVTATETAALIAVHFKRGTSLTRESITVQVHEPPWLGPVQQEPNLVMVPVSIPWRSFVLNP